MKKASIKIAGVILAAAMLAACASNAESAPVTSMAQSLPVVSAAPSSSAAPSEAPYASPIDFENLASKGGTDICAWMKVGGTNVDHPVTVGVDNTFYLNHDAYGEYFAGGTPFIDMINAADFSDPVTLMYGHVMPDDTIFSQLHLFKDPAFFEENRTMTLYLPENCYTYEIFAAFPHDASNLLYEKDYTDPAAFESLLEYIEKQAKNAPDESNVDMDGITPTDKLLLLSTCDNEGASRYLVAARLAETAVG